MERQLLLSEAADIDDTTRNSMLSSIRATVDAVRRRISLPGSSSITLTARQGQVPLTILLSDQSLRPHVLLRLSSQKLSFRPFAPGGVNCVPSGPTSEVCALTLAGPATTLKVPVETRTSGVFPLDVSLESPDGSLVLATNHDTVRSTAVSGVGIVLIVGATLFLAVWWIRDLRHGRRARRLVEPPPDEDDSGQPARSTPAEPPEAVSRVDSISHPATADAVIEEFFAHPPPELPVTIGSEWESKDPTETSVPRRP
jgi:hypothetical protein